MFAGFLPLLAQMPFFMVMYSLFNSATVRGQGNDLLGHTLFGTPLGTHWASTLSSGFSVESMVFLGLFAALAVLAWLSMRWQARLVPTSGQPRVCCPNSCGCCPSARSWWRLPAVGGRPLPADHDGLDLRRTSGAAQTRTGESSNQPRIGAAAAVHTSLPSGSGPKRRRCPAAAGGPRRSAPRR